MLPLDAQDDDLDLRVARQKVFARTAAYEAAIAHWFGGEVGDFPRPDDTAVKGHHLRYGENPGRGCAAFYVEPQRSIAALKQKGGRSLILSQSSRPDGALFATVPSKADCLRVVKHTTPGVLQRESSSRGLSEAPRV